MSILYMDRSSYLQLRDMGDKTLMDVWLSLSRGMKPPKPKSSFRHLKQGIQEFHRKYVLVPPQTMLLSFVVTTLTP